MYVFYSFSSGVMSIYLICRQLAYIKCTKCGAYIMVDLIIRYISSTLEWDELRDALQQLCWQIGIMRHLLSPYFKHGDR